MSASVGWPKSLASRTPMPGNLIVGRSSPIGDGRDHSSSDEGGYHGSQVERSAAHQEQGITTLGQRQFSGEPTEEESQ